MTSIDNLNKRLDRLQKEIEKSGRIITTSEVSINQVAIEVKVMKIGNKQVTLAVFKQLPEKQIIDFATGKLRGQPWGRVNYHPDCDKEMVSHFHIVWQEENMLYRSAIEQRWQYPYLPDELYAEGPNPIFDMCWKAETYLLTRILEGWLPDQTTKKRVSIQIENEKFSFSLEGSSTLFDNAVKSLANYNYCQKELEKWEHIVKKKHNETGPRYPDSYYDRTLEEKRTDFQRNKQSFANTQREIISQLEAESLPVESSIFYKTHLVPAFLALHQFKQTWRQSYAQLEQLDQLFIAV